MKDAHFSWIDLSTFDTAKANRFYRTLFGWEVETDAAGYSTCHRQGTLIAGFYEMPAFFQKINMPSFWMTTLTVPDLDKVVDLARNLGAKIEMEEESGEGRIALIRDPAGAGFTCYEGPARSGTHLPEQAGYWGWMELMVSDATQVIPFYQQLFGWTIHNDTPDRYSIVTSSGKRIGAIQEASLEEKGPKEYWAVYFTVPDLQQALQDVEAAGGQSGGTFPHEQGEQGLAYDDQGAAFFLLEATGTSNQHASTSAPVSRPAWKWRSILGLFLLYGIVLFEQSWAWGLLFLVWMLPDLKSGRTYFLEPVDRYENPFLFWTIMITWGILSLWMVTAGFSGAI